MEAVLHRRPRRRDMARTGRQRAVAGEGTLGETAAGERRRGCRTGADVPTLTGPDSVLTSGAQVAPTCGAVVGGPRRASGARASAAVGAMAVLVLRSGPAADSASARSVPPYMRPPAATPQHAPYKAVAPATGNPGWRRGVPSPMCDHPHRPRNPLLQGRRAATASDPAGFNPPINTPPRQPVKGGQSIEKSTPLFPPDPLQKSEKKVKDNLKWRIN